MMSIDIQWEPTNSRIVKESARVLREVDVSWKQLAMTKMQNLHK